MAAWSERLVLDTNLLVRYIRQDRLSQWVEAQYGLLRSVMPLLISVVSEGEMRGLALQFGWGNEKQQTMQALLDYLTIIPLPFAHIVDAYAQIDDYSRRRGVAMGKNDLWIAATAHVTEARLLTTDWDFDHLHPAFLTRDWIDPALA